MNSFIRASLKKQKSSEITASSAETSNETERTEIPATPRSKNQYRGN